MHKMKSHASLIKHARHILRKVGFRTDDIREEYSVTFGGETFRLDVAVVNNGSVIACAECGNFSRRKIAKLRRYIQFVLTLPYNKKQRELSIANFLKIRSN